MLIYAYVGTIKRKLDLVYDIFCKDINIDILTHQSQHWQSKTHKHFHNLRYIIQMLIMSNIKKNTMQIIVTCGLSLTYFKLCLIHFIGELNRNITHRIFLNNFAM